MKKSVSPIVVSMLSVMVLLLSAPVSAADAKTLKDAVVELKAEAKQSLKDNAWMRTTADYAKTNRLTGVDNDAVIAELGKKQDRDPSVDAYVKWQLMSYLRFGSLKKAGSRKMKNVVAKAPSYVPYPKVPQQLSNHWAKINGKTNPAKDKRMAADKAWLVFKEKIKNPTDTRNFPIIEYRKKLKASLPMGTFWRPYFRLLDLEAMIVAKMNPADHIKSKKGKISYASYYTGLLKAEDYSPKTRAAILDKIRSIKNMPAETYKAPYGKGKDGNIKYTAGLVDISKELKLSELENEFFYAVKEKERPVKGKN